MQNRFFNFLISIMLLLASVLSAAIVANKLPLAHADDTGSWVLTGGKPSFTKSSDNNARIIQEPFSKMKVNVVSGKVTADHTGPVIVDIGESRINGNITIKMNSTCKEGIKGTFSYKVNVTWSNKQGSMKMSAYASGPFSGEGNISEGEPYTVNFVPLDFWCKWNDWTGECEFDPFTITYTVSKVQAGQASTQAPPSTQPQQTQISTSGQALTKPLQPQQPQQNELSGWNVSPSTAVQVAMQNQILIANIQNQMVTAMKKDAAGRDIKIYIAKDAVAQINSDIHKNRGTTSTNINKQMQQQIMESPDKGQADLTVLSGKQASGMIDLGPGASNMIKAVVKIILNLPPGDTFTIGTGQGIVKVKGTELVVEEAPGASTVKVLKGSVEFTSLSTAAMNTITAGEQCSATNTGLGKKTTFDVKQEQAKWPVETSSSANPTKKKINIGPLSCFIATAAYGSETAAELDTLRAFRDRVLMQSEAGRVLVDTYYRASPPLAEFIAEHEDIRTFVRERMLDPIVSALNTSRALWDR